MVGMDGGIPTAWPCHRASGICHRMVQGWRAGTASGSSSQGRILVETGSASERLAQVGTVSLLQMWWRLALMHSRLALATRWSGGG